MNKILLLILLVSSLSLVQARECHSCVNCEKPTGEFMTCKPSEPVCITVTVQAPTLPKTVNRGCASENFCSAVQNPLITACETCNKDRCNSGTDVRVRWGLLVLSVLGAVYFGNK